MISNFVILKYDHLSTFFHCQVVFIKMFYIHFCQHVLVSTEFKINCQHDVHLHTFAYITHRDRVARIYEYIELGLRIIHLIEIFFIMYIWNVFKYFYVKYFFLLFITFLLIAKLFQILGLKVSKPPGWALTLSYIPVIGQEHFQHCCCDVCQISKWSDKAEIE